MRVACSLSIKHIHHKRTFKYCEVYYLKGEWGRHENPYNMPSFVVLNPDLEMWGMVQGIAKLKCISEIFTDQSFFK